MTTRTYLKYSHALGLWDVRRDSDQAILKSFPQKSLAETWAKKQDYTIVPE